MNDFQKPNNQEADRCNNGTQRNSYETVREELLKILDQWINKEKTE
ncbi:hypothetical protein [Brevibacillus centrosporus]|uniref:Uncharacterized protein n=1 Tax=Brevibacillus centrosporus TaxID=54910 RepID=A0A1I4DCT3_9BACL|nr:hypothetical protein [Brevibacillus centrosporus]SFK90915.1 hypothetical protein SAMN05518846_12374 [Brevibacillus centrosporus]